MHRSAGTPLILPYGKLFHAITSDCISDTRTLRYVDGAFFGDLHRRLDDILAPIAMTGGHVARKCETGESGHRDVVSTTNTRFQHSAAPYRHASFFACFLQSAGLCMPADATEFDIDDPTGLEFDGGNGV